MGEISLYSHLVETLCFFVRQHHYRSKYFLLSENLPERVAQLLGSSEKHLKLSALKFFRTCVGLQDEFYIRHMVKNKLFEPILNVVVETMPKDNLLNSACLEFFEYIRRVSVSSVSISLTLPLPKSTPKQRADLFPCSGKHEIHSLTPRRNISSTPVLNHIRQDLQLDNRAL